MITSFLAISIYDQLFPWIGDMMDLTWNSCMQLNLPLRSTIGISVYGAGLPANSEAQVKGESVWGECCLGVWRWGRSLDIYRKTQQIKFLIVR